MVVGGFGKLQLAVPILAGGLHICNFGWWILVHGRLHIEALTGDAFGYMDQL